MEQSIARFEKRLDEANDALKTLGGNLGTGARGSYKELTAALTALRRNASKTNKQALKDFDKLRAALTKSNGSAGSSRTARKSASSSRTGSRSTASRSTAKPATAKRSTTKSATAKRSTTKSATAKRSTTTRTTGRRTTASRSRAKKS